MKAESTKMEMKMSKKISVRKAPASIRELLATGLLEGLKVNYFIAKKPGLTGVINGICILCHCASCQGSNAISPYQFEQHAGSSKKHPPESIYLENGKTIRDVLEACKAAPLDMLDVSIKNAIRPVHQKNPLTCQKCTDTIISSGTGRSDLLCDSCLKSDQRQATPSLASGSYGSASLSKSPSSHKKATPGKLTRKDLGLHKLVFMGDTLPEGTEVGYYVGGKKKRQGYIKDSGILCDCCSSVLSPSQFEAHAGHASRRKPYNNIYTSNGVSLHELAVSLSKNRKLSASENDDLCSICADGGDLLLCDLCPRAFHTDCVGLSTIPKGDWCCRYCQSMHQRERCLEHNDNAIAAGRVAGVDPIEQIYERCIRIVQAPELSVGGCVFCRRHDFSKAFGPRTVLLCDQCEREYHVGCLKDHKMADFKEIPKEEWFCSRECSTIHAALQRSVIYGEVQLQLSDLDIIKKHRESDSNANANIRWRLLNRKTIGPETKSLYTAAVSILHESFDAIVESTSGRDLIPCMVYGRSTNDQDFRGMYCAVLTVDSSVVSTGILRVLGSGVAELPLVATQPKSQGQGYFQLLFSCIEKLLSSLKIKHLVLPAATVAESIWTGKFGFSRITPDQLNEYTGGSPTMSFHGTSMLHKLVPSELGTSELVSTQEAMDMDCT